MATFVLVHGSFHGGWVWRHVARRLRAAGHDVLAPTLTGSGERIHLLSREVGLATHVDDVVNAIVHEDARDIVLVGHSYGGAVITMAADRVVDRLRRLVFLDAVAPTAGQCATGGFADNTKLTELGDDWLLPPLPFDCVGVTDPDDVAFMDARRHPHPMATLYTPVSPTGEADSVPRSYIVFSAKQAMLELFGVDPLRVFVERAEREGWRMQTIEAGHDAMFTHPEPVTAALLAELE